jgi:hypothetical protein
MDRESCAAHHLSYKCFIKVPATTFDMASKKMSPKTTRACKRFAVWWLYRCASRLKLAIEWKPNISSLWTYHDFLCCDCLLCFTSTKSQQRMAHFSANFELCVLPKKWFIRKESYRFGIKKYRFPIPEKCLQWNIMGRNCPTKGYAWPHFWGSVPPPIYTYCSTYSMMSLMDMDSEYANAVLCTSCQIIQISHEVGHLLNSITTVHTMTRAVARPVLSVQ